MDIVEVQQGLGNAVGQLDELSKRLEEAHKAMNSAEEAWLAAYDTTAEALKEDMVKAGRKGDPAEHWIESHARRGYPLEWKTWREAKRLVDMLEKISRNRQSELTGYQTLLRTEGALSGAPDLPPGQQRPPAGLPAAARGRYQLTQGRLP